MAGVSKNLWESGELREGWWTYESSDDNGGAPRGDLTRGGWWEQREYRDWVPEATIAKGARDSSRGGKHQKAPETFMYHGGFTLHLIKIICHQNCIRLTPSASILLTAP